MQEKPKIEKNYALFVVGLWPQPQKNEPKVQENLKSRKLNWGSTCVQIL